MQLDLRAQRLLDPLRREDGRLDLPIDTTRLAQAHGLRVIVVDEGLTGTILQNCDGIPVSGLLDFTRGRIYVDGSEVPSRRRFTIAHELAHEVLGHESLLGGGLHAVATAHVVESSRVESSRDASDDVVAPGDATSPAQQLLEEEANHLAGRLLVPPDELASAVAAIGIASIPILAERFAVSADAMRRHAAGWLPIVVDTSS